MIDSCHVWTWFFTNQWHVECWHAEIEFPPYDCFTCGGCFCPNFFPVAQTTHRMTSSLRFMSSERLMTQFVAVTERRWIHNSWEYYHLQSGIGKRPNYSHYCFSHVELCFETKQELIIEFKWQFGMIFKAAGVRKLKVKLFKTWQLTIVIHEDEDEGWEASNVRSCTGFFL